MLESYIEITFEGHGMVFGTNYISLADCSLIGKIVVTILIF
jgi:hypothetical protein